MMLDLSKEHLVETQLTSARETADFINNFIENNMHSRTIHNRIEAGYLHLEAILAREHIIADSSDKSDIINTITAAKNFISQNISE
jgi:hypothetical protein